MKRFLIFIIFFYSTLNNAQDVIFSQSFLVPETINTSFTGATKGTKVGAISRSQWRSSALKVSSNFAFMDTWFEGFNFGIGINILNQKESGSSYSFNQVNFNYAMAFQLSDTWFFRPSISAGIGSKSYGFQNLLLEDQINLGNNFLNTASIDPSILKSQRSFADISSSILFNNEYSWVGITFRHLNKPNISLTQTGNLPLDVFFTVHGKYYLPVLDNVNTWLANNSKIYLLTNYMKQGPFNRLDAGIQYIFDDSISLGLTVGSNVVKNNNQSKSINSFSTFTGVQWKGYRFGYSFDFNTSELMNTGGIHEFSISYDFSVNIRELNRYKCIPFF